MMQGLDDLLAATLVFVAGHFLLSSQVLRQPLASRLGETGFLGLYSLIAFAALLWMVFAYGAAPVVTLWEPPAVLRWVPLILMPFALFLAVAGLTSPNPTMVGGERVVDGGPEDQTPGIVRITRHPFLWGVTLWAIGHLAVRGDGASLILFGGILVLALGGMWHIDQRREASLGAAWGPVRMTTSVLPFAALASGRTRMDWRGIGWWRPLAALALYAALLHFHPQLFGVSPLPV